MQSSDEHFLYFPEAPGQNSKLRACSSETEQRRFFSTARMASIGCALFVRTWETGSTFLESQLGTGRFLVPHSELRYELHSLRVGQKFFHEGWLWTRVGRGCGVVRDAGDAAAPVRVSGSCCGDVSVWINIDEQTSIRTRVSFISLAPWESTAKSWEFSLLPCFNKPGVYFSWMFALGGASKQWKRRPMFLKSLVHFERFLTQKQTAIPKIQKKASVNITSSSWPREQEWWCLLKAVLPSQIKTTKMNMNENQNQETLPNIAAEQVSPWRLHCSFLLHQPAGEIRIRSHDPCSRWHMTWASWFRHLSRKALQTWLSTSGPGFTIQKCLPPRAQREFSPNLEEKRPSFITQGLGILQTWDQNFPFVLWFHHGRTTIQNAMWWGQETTTLGFMFNWGESHRTQAAESAYPGSCWSAANRELLKHTTSFLTKDMQYTQSNRSDSQDAQWVWYMGGLCDWAWIPHRIDPAFKWSTSAASTCWFCNKW